MDKHRTRIFRAQFGDGGAIALEQRSRIGVGIDVDVAELDKRDVEARALAHRGHEILQLAQRVAILGEELVLDGERYAKFLHTLQDVRADRLVAEVDARFGSGGKTRGEEHGHQGEAQHPLR